MSTVEFYYQNYRIFIYCREEEKMYTICRNYCFKIQLDFKLVDFIYDGKKIDFDLTFAELINENDKLSKKMKIIVIQKSLIKSSNLVCPECREIISVEIKDYKINLFGCKNGHKINNLSLKEYQDKINKIHFEDICCDNCKENSYMINNKIFKCFTCHQNLCSKCRFIHDGDHYVINNEMKDYICPEHNNERFISYCEDCKQNLCFLCENDHENHNIIIFRKIIHQKEEYMNHFSKLKEYIEIFNNNINEIIKNLNKVLEQIKLYKKIYEDILNDSFFSNRNYIIFRNINEFYNSSIIEDINNINKDNNVISKFDKIMRIYNKINDGNNKEKEEKKIKETKIEEKNNKENIKEEFKENKKNEEENIKEKNDENNKENIKEEFKENKKNKKENIKEKNNENINVKNNENIKEKNKEEKNKEENIKEKNNENIKEKNKGENVKEKNKEENKKDKNKEENIKEKNNENIKEKNNEEEIEEIKEKNNDDINKKNKEEIKEKSKDKKEKNKEEEINEGNKEKIKLKNKEDIKEKEYKTQIKEKEKNKEEIEEKLKNDEIIKDIMNEIIKKIEKNDEKEKEKEKNKEEIKEKLKNDEIIKDIMNEIIKKIEKNAENEKEDIEKAENNEKKYATFIIDNRVIKINNIITFPPDNTIRRTNTTSNDFKDFLTLKANFSKYISEDNIEVKNSFERNNLKRNSSSNGTKNKVILIKQYKDNVLLNDIPNNFESKKKFYHKSDYSNDSDLNISKYNETFFPKNFDSSSNFKKKKKRLRKKII